MDPERCRVPHWLVARLGGYWLAVLIVVPFTTVFWSGLSAALLHATGITVGWIGLSSLVGFIAAMSWIATTIVARPLAKNMGTTALQDNAPHDAQVIELRPIP